MLGLIITDTHLLVGAWSSNKDKHVLNDLKYIAFSKSIKEVLKSQNSIRTVLKEAIDKYNIQGSEVMIAIDDDLLYHDKFNSDETLTKREIWDYIQWETKQKWGDLGNFYTTFAEIDSPNPNTLHSITCPTFLITEIKAIIANQKAKPLWAGPISTVYLENTKFRNAVYMTDDDSFIKFFYRGRDGYSEGKLRFVAGQPNVTVGIGDKEEQSNLFSSPNDARDFVTIDLISDANNAHLRQFRHKRIIPFDGIEVKIDDIPEDISFNLLNALSIIIKDFSFENIVDFLNPEKIQNKKYTGVGRLTVNQVEKTEKAVENKSETKVVEKSKVHNKKIKKVRDRHKSSRVLPFLLVILIGILGYYLFFTDPGKALVSNLKAKIDLTKSDESLDKTVLIDQQFNQSSALINVYSSIITVISPDSIISLNLKDNSGGIDFIGKDSIDIPNIILTNYSIDPIDCCGGIKQQLDFSIIQFPEIKANIWMNLPDILDQLKSSIGINKIRQLDMIVENDLKYTPIIFETESFSQIGVVIEYLKHISDNVIIRKIDITNTPPNNNHIGRFYIAVFEPL